MANLDLEVSGLESLAEEINDIEDKWSTDRAYKVGSNAEYGIILEMGRGPITAQEGEALKFEVNGETVFAKRVDGHEPYPWFKPAIREFQANPERFIVDNTGYPSIDAIPNADKFLEAIAAGLASQMEKNVSADSSGDRSPGTHPEHPSTDTGNLRNSIGFTRIR